MARFSAESIRQSDDYFELCKDAKNIDLSRPFVTGITIDDVTTRDIDDAVYIERKDDQWVVTVSIADVAEAVPIGSPIFNEALERKETLYLPGNHIQMLPNGLSLYALSLFPNLNRNTITFRTTLDNNLNVVDFKVYESRCVSKDKVDYKTVNTILKDREETNPYYEMLKNADFLAKQLLAKRRMSGALAFYDLKFGLVTDEEGNIVKMKSRSDTSGYIIIQELMILTNSEASKFFAKADIDFVFRNHTARRNVPDKEQVMEQITLSMGNVNMLKTLSDKINLWCNRAVYETTLTGHFGLSLPAYTHVTSPIRRLADLLNHHIIKAYLRNEEPPFSQEQIDSYCSEINEYINEKKDAQAEYFKSIEDKKRLEDLQNTDYNDLLEMNEKDFRRMLKAVRQSDSIDNKLMDVFKNKIDSGVLVAIDVYELIYCSQWAKKQPDFIKMCFDYLDQTPGNYINFMAYLQRDGLIKEAYSETEAYRGSFFARYVFVSEDDTKLIVGKSTQNINKKKAIQEAARDINIGLYEDTLVELEEDSPIIPEDFKFQGVNMSKSASPNQISPTSDDTINYIGAINEVAQKHSQFSILSCDFKDMGGDGPNRFICTFTVSIIDEVKKIQAAGKNKKMAKSNAASEVFAVIRDGGLKKSGDVFAGH